MRALALLLLSLLAVARANVVIRGEEPNDVPGLQRETFYVVDDSPEARNADGASPVKGVMTHISASGPRAIAALFGGSSENSRWSSWLDQQAGALSSVQQALMPAVTRAAPRHRGCSRHKTAMAQAAAADEALPRSFSSLDEALLQRMVAARLSPQMLSLLMADAEREAPEYIVAVGSQGRPRPQVALAASDFVARGAAAHEAMQGSDPDSRGYADNQVAEQFASNVEQFEPGFVGWLAPEAAEQARKNHVHWEVKSRSTTALELCDETGCTVQFQGSHDNDGPRAAAAKESQSGKHLVLENCDENGCSVRYEGGEEPRVAQAQPKSLPSSRFFGSRPGAVSFEAMADQRRGVYEAAVAAGREGDNFAWQPRPADDSMLSPMNPGLILFMFLCTACVFVWTRLAILCCTLRQCTGRRHRRRCRKAGREASLLEPLAPEAAASDSLAIYTDALYAPPKGLHPQVFGARPYGVQVAAEHTTAPPQGNAYVTIQYVPLQSEGANKA